MKINEIKRTVEEVVRTEYVAEDGTVFYSKEEAEQYEKSALFVVSNKLKRLAITTHYEFNDAYSDDNELEIFDVQTEEDLENLKRYLYLKLSQVYSNEDYFMDDFVSKDGKRNQYVFENVTIGHEVLIFWSYDKDHFWVYNDGSMQGYFEYSQQRLNDIIEKYKRFTEELKEEKTEH